ncbi:hypothetical protein LE190_16455 [Massilia oculi]|uniref:Uncharacterized protein n=1 Tax=Massilia hydrophila TaxID=3044279 RepID=A0ABS7YCT0_9BURK|nr:hypothetical protein [Massilia oculi]MCA1857507.1 hypothetical protein [Massilia oculi]
MNAWRTGLGRGALALLLATALPAAQADGGDGDSLRIMGAIDARSADRIIAFVDGGGRRIVIDSEGGDAEAGMRIAERLAGAEVEVVVNRYCFSSCANYVFVPARSKALNEGAVLGFHGGIPDTRHIRLENLAPETRGLFEMMSRNYERQAALFGPLGVDTALFGGAGKLAARVSPTPVYSLDCAGKLRTFAVEKAAKRALADCMQRRRKFEFTIGNGLDTTVYFPSRETLERYGVRGIGAYPYPADQRAMRALAAGMGFKLELVGDVE